VAVLTRVRVFTARVALVVVPLLAAVGLLTFAALAREAPSVGTGLAAVWIDVRAALVRSAAKAGDAANAIAAAALNNP
jgi:hypothetical protein